MMSSFSLAYFPSVHLFDEMSVYISSHFKIRLFTLYCWVFRVLCVFRITVFIRCVLGKYCVSVYVFSSHSLDHWLFLTNTPGIGLFSLCGFWVRSDNEQPREWGFSRTCQTSKLGQGDGEGPFSRTPNLICPLQCLLDCLLSQGWQWQDSSFAGCL